MNRSGGVVALTVVGVLVAGGTAAAVNTVILHSGGSVTVNSAENFLVIDGSTDSSVTPSSEPTADQLVPTPVTNEAVPTQDTTTTTTTASRTQVTRQRTTTSARRTTTTTRTVSRSSSVPVVTFRPRPVESHGVGHGNGGGNGSSNGSSGGSGHGGPTPSPTIPTNGGPDD
jgi:hypothetical protein